MAKKNLNLKGNKKLLLFVGLSLIILVSIWARDVQAVACQSTAGVRCLLSNYVTSGSVTCTLDRQYYCANCTGSAPNAGQCTISSGNNQCTISGLDCQCSPFRVEISVSGGGSVSNGGVTYSNCNGLYNWCIGYGYPAYYDPYHWVCVANPGTCTINIPYTPPAPPAYTLSVSVAGTGSGTVTSSPAGINCFKCVGPGDCPADCSQNYDYNTSVVLTAVASAGSAFSGWSGSGCSGTGACTVSMTANQSVTANFNTNGCPPIDSWCSNHGGIALTVPYDVSTWAQCLAWCNLNMNSNLPLCQDNDDGPRNCWINYAPVGGLANCIWDTSHPPYGAFWGTCPFPPIDNTPPSGTILINGGAVFTNTTSAALTLTCADSDSGCSKMKFSNDNATWSAEENYAAAKAWTLTGGDGAKTVYVRYKDVAGNWSGSFSDTIILDATLPSGAFTPASQTWTKNNVSVVFNPSDAGNSGVKQWRYRVSSNGGTSWGAFGGYTMGDTNGTIVLNTTGNWKINSEVTDNANNINSGVYSGLYQIDKIAPSVTAFDVQPRTTTSSVVISWTVADSGGSYLNRVEVWRANYNSSNCSETNKTGCSWSQIGSPSYAPVSSNSWSSSVVNTPPAGNSYWYGLHVLDNAGNLGKEASSIKVSANQPPSANFSCLPTNCTVYTGEALNLNNTSSDPDNNLVRSEWDILSWGLAPDLTCCASGCNSSTILCNYAVQSLIVGNGTFNIKLTVKDAQNETASLTKTFYIKQGAVADFQCSLDNVVWSACQNFEVKTGETVYFQSQSTPSEGASIISWSWAFQDAAPPTAITSNPSTKFSSSGVKTVSLTIQDSAARSASRSYNLKSRMPFPEWTEVPPF